jgi:hypothetical protein
MSNLPRLRNLIRNALLTLQRQRRNFTCCETQLTESAPIRESLDYALNPRVS